mgnify:CR=1 FL=1|tara:strand:+ start:558 stop:827 length:270 start_codon:yes stop_codon:yes gene_type:complete
MCVLYVWVIISFDVRVVLEQYGNIQNSGVNMILTPEEAKELGEALVDAAETVQSAKKDQNVILVKDTAVSVNADLLMDDWELVATVSDK